MVSPPFAWAFFPLFFETHTRDFYSSYVFPSFLLSFTRLVRAPHGASYEPTDSCFECFSICKPVLAASLSRKQRIACCAGQLFASPLHFAKLPFVSLIC